MPTTLGERDEMRSRIAQLEHDERWAAQHAPRSVLRQGRQAELKQLKRELRKALEREYDGSPR